LVDNSSFGPFGPVAETLLVALGALGVAAMFQDYAYFHKPEVITPENVALKYASVIVASIVNTIVLRMHRKAARQEK